MTASLYLVPAITPPPVKSRITMRETGTGIYRSGIVTYSDPHGFELNTERPLTILIPLADVAALHVHPTPEGPSMPHHRMTEQIADAIAWLDLGDGHHPDPRALAAGTAQAVTAGWVDVTADGDLEVTDAGHAAVAGRWQATGGDVR